MQQMSVGVTAACVASSAAVLTSARPRDKIGQPVDAGVGPPVDGNDGPELGKSLAPERPRRRARQLGAELVEGREVAPAAKCLHGHDHDRPGVVQDPRELPGRREGADGHGDGADLGRGEER